MVCFGLHNEFRLRKFEFAGVRAERFCHSQWRVPVAAYIIYRLLLMVYGMFWLGYVTVFHGNPPQRWGAYLTNWTYILLNIYLIAHFLACIIHHAITLYQRNNIGHGGRYLFGCPVAFSHDQMFTELDRDTQRTGDYEAIPDSAIPAEVEVAQVARPPLYLCAVWILFNVVSSAALMVTIVFFSFLFPDLHDYPHIGLENLQVHLLNSVIIMLEHLITAVPYRLLHVIYPFLYGVIYLLFSVIYWSKDHSRVMYPILDWNKPGPTVGYVLMIGFVIIPILHSFFFLIYKVKMAIYRQISCGNGEQ